MKKTLLLITLACGISAASHAQGTFQWQAPATAMLGYVNTNTWSSFTTSSGNPAGATVGVTNGLARGYATQSIYYTLLTSSALNALPTTLSQFSGTLATAWLDTGLYMTNTAANNGRMTPISGSTATAANANWVNGSTQNAILVGWSANLGTSWSAALNNLNNWATLSSGIVGTAWFGTSAGVWTGVTPTLANPGTAVNWASLGASTTLKPLYVEVAPVPEPSTLALAGLGGLALLALRRRK